LSQLQKEYKISYDRVKNIVKDCKIISSAKRINPNLKENYFEEINSHEKAYWLGWIISDGSISNQKDKNKF
jgi:DNA-binding transcriptional regulator WhiA